MCYPSIEIQLTEIGTWVDCDWVKWMRIAVNYFQKYCLCFPLNKTKITLLLHTLTLRFSLFFLPEQQQWVKTKNCRLAAIFTTTTVRRTVSHWWNRIPAWATTIQWTQIPVTYRQQQCLFLVHVSWPTFLSLILIWINRCHHNRYRIVI